MLASGTAVGAVPFSTSRHLLLDSKGGPCYKRMENHCFTACQSWDWQSFLAHLHPLLLPPHSAQGRCFSSQVRSSWWANPKECWVSFLRRLHSIPKTFPDTCPSPGPVVDDRQRDTRPDYLNQRGGRAAWSVLWLQGWGRLEGTASNTTWGRLGVCQDTGITRMEPWGVKRLARWKGHSMRGSGREWHWGGKGRMWQGLELQVKWTELLDSQCHTQACLCTFVYAIPCSWGSPPSLHPSEPTHIQSPSKSFLFLAPVQP